MSSDPRAPQQPIPGDQQQPAPGLTSKMTPAPDHGEDSYVGKGLLTGLAALITGGDSGIGRAVAIAYAREGADVAINYHPNEEPDAREVIALIKLASIYVQLAAADASYATGQVYGSAGGAGLP